MKRRYCLLALLPLLASCGTGFDAKAVDSAADFIEVAACAELKISSAFSILNAITGGEAPSAGVSSRAYYYSNDDYRVEKPNDSHIGYTLVTEAGHRQYCLINNKTKTGVIYQGADSLEAERQIALNEIASQYGALEGIYDMMKGMAGKSAEELGLTKLEFRRSVAAEVAGYTLVTERIQGEQKIEANHYLMMDKIGDAWALTNYTVRETYSNKVGNGYEVDHYDVSYYVITVVNEYSAIPINLSGYTMTVEGLVVDDVHYDTGYPLSGR